VTQGDSDGRALAFGKNAIREGNPVSSIVASPIPVRTSGEARLTRRRQWKETREAALRWLRAHVSALAVVLAALYWVVDALIHTFVLRDGPFIEQLFPHDVNEIWMRSLAVALMVAFGVYAQRAIAVQRLLRQEAEKARRAAELAIRTKSEFLANTSHELRSPLNAIIGFAEIMKDELFGPMGRPQYAEYCEDIHASGTHLLEIINDILDLSKIEAGKLQLNEETVDLRHMIESCVRLMSVRAQESQVALETRIAPDLPRVCVDQRKMKQILLNLLSNAVKFTPEGGRVEISARLAGGGRFVLEVADSGIGIAPEHVETAMSAFGQLDSSLTRKYPGTGLGLPLTKGLVELHGGEFRLESAVNVGTRAIVTLPSHRVRADEVLIADLPHRKTA
jgi:signal transduction histidine kinase